MLLTSVFLVILNSIVAIVCNENISDNPGELSRQKCNEYKNLIPQNCNKITDDIIVNNLNEAQEQEFPHMAIIGYEKSNGDRVWVCGGVLISPQYVLTPAHCLNDSYLGPAKFVKMGTTNIKNSADIIEIRERIAHPKFRQRLVYNDIGLIRLESLVQFDCRIQPACLNTNQSIDKSRIIATTWHSFSETKDNDIGQLHKTIADLISQDSCNSTYASTTGPALAKGIDYDTQLCARYRDLKNPETLCRPDSGGALQIDPKERLYDIVGLASFGRRCLDAPIVYTRISAYVKWIEDVIWAD